LEGIAVRYATSVATLLKMNRLYSHVVYPGQVLYVPKRDETSMETNTVARTSSDIRERSSSDSFTAAELLRAEHIIHETSFGDV